MLLQEWQQVQFSTQRRKGARRRNFSLRSRRFCGFALKLMGWTASKRLPAREGTKPRPLEPLAIQFKVVVGATKTGILIL